MPTIQSQRGRKNKASNKELAETSRPKQGRSSLPIQEVARATITVPELAAYTGYSPDTIRRAIASGELQAANGGGKSPYRITKSAADAWFQQRGGGSLYGDKQAPAPSFPSEPAINEDENKDDFFSALSEWKQRRQASDLQGIDVPEVIRQMREGRSGLSRP